eukprot:TRINITY_DN13426_c0_g1_i2.p1 TRINITY_DN13426_c0_g1~~TRINITY_DN13426_c0_g1_i2.p1  ORF type:complete len:317 (+),score=48.24 TRINITY_DN13426_c0_g1_i2:317-1267(+)
MPFDFPMTTHISEREHTLGLRRGSGGAVQRTSKQMGSRRQISKADSKAALEDCRNRSASSRSLAGRKASVGELGSGREESKGGEFSANVREVKKPLYEKIYKDKPYLFEAKEVQSIPIIENQLKERLVLQSLGMKESEVPLFLKYYKSTISASITESYSPLEELLKQTQAGYNPHWLCLKVSEDSSKDYSSIKGLVVFYLEAEEELKRQVSVLHASAAEELLANLLEETVKYIWVNVNCKEIKVVLNHIEYIGHFIIYKPLKTAYQRLHFKSLAQNETHKQTLVLDLDKSALHFLLLPKYLLHYATIGAKKCVRSR